MPVFAFVLWLVFAVLVGIIASSKGRSGFGYFLLSIVLSPLIGFLFVVAMPKVDKDESEQKNDKVAKPAVTRNTVRSQPSAPLSTFKDTRSCPKCAEDIKKAATVCRFCGHELEAETSKPKSEYIDIKVFAKEFGIKEEKIIKDIRNNEMRGRNINGSWQVHYSEVNKQSA